MTFLRWGSSEISRYELGREMRIGEMVGEMFAPRIAFVRQFDPRHNPRLHGPVVPDWLLNDHPLSFTLETRLAIVAMIRAGIEVGMIADHCGVSVDTIVGTVAKAVQNGLLPPTDLGRSEFFPWRNTLVARSLATLADRLERRRKREVIEMARNEVPKGREEPRGSKGRSRGASRKVRSRPLDQSTIRRIEDLVGLAGRSKSEVARHLSIPFSTMAGYLRTSRTEGRVLPRRPDAPVEGTDLREVERWLETVAGERPATFDDGSGRSGLSGILDELAREGPPEPSAPTPPFVHSGEAYLRIENDTGAHVEFRVPDVGAHAAFLDEFSRSVLPRFAKGRVKAVLAGEKSFLVFGSVVARLMHPDVERLDLQLRGGSEDVPPASFDETSGNPAP